jgi:hypothetical protein
VICNAIYSRKSVAIIDYESQVAIPRHRPHWFLAVIVGTLIGYGVAHFAYEQTLHVLANGNAYWVGDHDEAVRNQTRFIAAMMLSGIFVCICITVVCPISNVRAVVLWALLFSTVFCTAAIASLYFSRHQPLPAGAFMPLSSSATLTAPIAGCIAVSVVLSVVLFLRRGAASRRIA